MVSDRKLLFDKITRSKKYADGVRAFGNGDYFLAHEYWEAVWLKQKDIKIRHWVQGQIQIAGAFLLLEKGRKAASKRLLSRALHHLISSNNW